MRKLIVILIAVAALAACRKRETPAPHTAAQPSSKPAVVRGQPATTAAETPATSTETNVGAPMPPYEATTLDGKPFNLASERGNVVFLNLWATWCGPCRFEIPELQKLHDQYASQRFKVIGVSLDDSGADTVKQFVGSHQMTYPILLDPDGKLANLFNTSVIPTSVLVDRNGRIVWKKLGIISTDDESLTKALSAALAAPKT